MSVADTDVMGEPLLTVQNAMIVFIIYLRYNIKGADETAYLEKRRNSSQMYKTSTFFSILNTS